MKTAEQVLTQSLVDKSDEILELLNRIMAEIQETADNGSSSTNFQGICHNVIHDFVYMYLQELGYKIEHKGNYWLIKWGSYSPELINNIIAKCKETSNEN